MQYLKQIPFSNHNLKQIHIRNQTNKATVNCVKCELACAVTTMKA